jgi:hypothetical protein
LTGYGPWSFAGAIVSGGQCPGMSSNPP